MVPYLMGWSVWSVFMTFLGHTYLPLYPHMIYLGQIKKYVCFG